MKPCPAGFSLSIPNISTMMTTEELQSAITRTLAEIVRIKQQIAETADPREKRRLIRKKRELQYLQLWHLGLLEEMEYPPQPWFLVPLGGFLLYHNFLDYGKINNNNPIHYSKEGWL